MTSSPRSRAPRRSALTTQADAVLRASRALVGIAAESLGEIDDLVTVPQFRVLVLLHTRGPMNLASVAAELGVNPSNASRTCDRLINARLLDRRESQVDRRNITLTLKPSGRRLVEKVTEHRRAAIERVLRSMKAEERTTVAAALEAFALAAGEPTSDGRTISLLWPPESA
ncbi:MarR family transcriptional regulator [Mycolicibacterium chubuense]|uniref:MarR family winged helix-turn-helix transcriptional regulator n=1 Tax=Mycolicibacterium chubuense TaxID=1800 RepID=UPI0006532986|nr:MarR family transcriptional regulator [Mycolicibacterium chubuense]ORA54033.1 MarR family transcriptional regulator [Mycolicibacterium chubuense]